MNSTIHDTLVRALFDDPLYRWLYPAAATRQAALDGTISLILDRAHQTGRIVSGHHGKAVAVWTGPGVSLLEDPTPYMELLAHWSPDRVDAATTGMASCATHEPADAAELHLLGVHPDLQGRGIATGLLASELLDLDAAHQAAYLTSSNPRNISLYQRCGFTTLAQVPIADGGPVIRPMLRSPSHLDRLRTPREPPASHRCP